jgi:hypothetical protein
MLLRKVLHLVNKPIHARHLVELLSRKLSLSSAVLQLITTSHSICQIKFKHYLYLLSVKI